MRTMKKMHQNLFVQSYTKNMGLVDKSDMMVNSYIVSWKVWKWARKSSST
jgi:hypothetical protein